MAITLGGRGIASSEINVTPLIDVLRTLFVGYGRVVNRKVVEIHHRSKVRSLPPITALRTE